MGDPGQGQVLDIVTSTDHSLTTAPIPAFALWIGLYRQLIMPPIVFYLVTRVWGIGLNGIWWGIFTVTWSAALVAVFFARRQVERMTRAAKQEAAS